MRPRSGRWPLFAGRSPPAGCRSRGPAPSSGGCGRSPSNAASPEAVTFLGRLEREAIAALYQTADVALNPSRVDNMPNSLLEALASGVPVVSTRCRRRAVHGGARPHRAAGSAAESAGDGGERRARCCAIASSPIGSRAPGSPTSSSSDGPRCDRSGSKSTVGWLPAGNAGRRSREGRGAAPGRLRTPGWSSSVLFPLHERLKGHDSRRRLRALEATQWLDRERLEELQLQNLRRFLVDIERTVPYYTALFADNGFVPGAMTSVADLARVPFLTKPLIRENVDRLKAQGAGKLIRYNTGGSSGEPLVFYMGLDRVSHDVAAKWRATRWWDVDIGDPEIVVWGSPIELGAQDRLRRLRDRVLRTELLPAFDMSEPNLDRFIARIKARRPKMLFGYPSALAHIARHAERRRDCARRARDPRRVRHLGVPVRASAPADRAHVRLPGRERLRRARRRIHRARMPGGIAAHHGRGSDRRTDRRRRAARSRRANRARSWSRTSRRAISPSSATAPATSA